LEGLDDGTVELDGEDLEEVSRPEIYLSDASGSSPGVDRIDSGEVAAVLEGLAELSSAKERQRDGGLAAMLDGLPKKERTLEIEEDDLIEEDEIEEDDLDAAETSSPEAAQPRARPKPPPPPSRDSND
jgi:hypothetical protein